MAGAKETYQFELTNDQIGFVRSAKEQYDIPDEGKVMRIIVDYLLSSPDIRNTVFNETRCLRCD